MIDFNEAIISISSAQRFSSDTSNIKTKASLFDYSGDEEQVLKKIFTKPFTSSFTTYEFAHEVDVELNVLNKLSNSARSSEDFLKTSNNIYKHLLSVSKHPNIKDGDLFVVKFEEVRMDNHFYEALGIYKIESKETFIETGIDGDKLSVQFKKGITGRKIDKACLILFTEQPYTVFVVDNNSTETDYWKNDFIRVRYKNDNANNTNHLLSLTKSFVTKAMPEQYELNKSEQADLLNKTVNYFKENESFDIKEFQNSVFEDKDYIKSFQKYGSQYADEKGIDIAAKFEIFTEVVKKQEKAFKSVVKLDKNFHIYIHGRTDLIEKGVDKNGMKYYKIYYKEEN